MNTLSIHLFALDAIQEAADLIRRACLAPLEIDQKTGKNDLVTNVDRRIERHFRERIAARFPAHRVLAEEGTGRNAADLAGTVWIIDPIDGTMNFVHQRRNFAISVGIYRDGEPLLGYIYDSAADEMLFAAKGEGAYFQNRMQPKLAPVAVGDALIGISSYWAVPNRKVDSEGIGRLIRDCHGARSFGSAALELAHVATGRLDAYLSLRLSPWDIAGGLIIASEAGAICTTLQGAPPNLLKTDTFIAAKPGLHGQVLAEYVHLLPRN